MHFCGLLSFNLGLLNSQTATCLSKNKRFFSLNYKNSRILKERLSNNDAAKRLSIASLNKHRRGIKFYPVYGSQHLKNFWNLIIRVSAFYLLQNEKPYLQTKIETDLYLLRKIYSIVCWKNVYINIKIFIHSDETCPVASKGIFHILKWITTNIGQNISVMFMAKVCFNNSQYQSRYFRIFRVKVLWFVWTNSLQWKINNNTFK